MMKIRHPNLEALALRHYNSIVDGLKGVNTKNRLEAQNERIKKVFSNDFDFRRIVLASPEEMENLVEIWKKKGGKAKEFTYYSNCLYEKYFRSGDKFKIEEGDYNALKLVQDLGIDVCPYCNRNFIYNTAKDGKTTCQMDHFHPQSKFPFLAISFYNLIPVCSFCNLTKGDEIKDLLNPYNDISEYNYEYRFNAKISVKIKDSKFYYKTESIEVNFDTKDSNQRTKNHVKTFHLHDLYKGHDDYVLELIQKKYAYSEAYIDNLFRQYEGTIFKNREDILRFIANNYVDESDLSKRPLAKLTKDITEQLDL